LVLVLATGSVPLAACGAGHEIDAEQVVAYLNLLDERD
jgi:hypothetical protein